VFSLIVLLLMQNEFCSLDLSTLSNISIWLMCSALAITFVRKKNIFSVSMIYLSVFSCFHFGMTLAFAFDLPMSEDILHVYTNYWPKTEFVKEAIYLSTLGVMSLVLGFSFVKNKTPINQNHFILQGYINKEDFKSRLERCGFGILLGSILFWCYKTISAGGVSLMVGSYSVFLEKTKDSGLSFLYYLIGFGLIMLLVAGKGLLVRVGIYVFAIFAIVGFPLGLRGEILFPIAAALAVSSTTLVNVSKRKALVLVFILLCAIGGVRVLRQAGVNDYRFSFQDFSPHNALMEMGGQIWSVAEMCCWKNQGEGELLGASFWAPFERGLYHFLPGMERLPAEQDERLLQLLLEQRVSAIGFSPIAEGYRNFGTLGVISVMICIGFTVGLIENMQKSLVAQALSAVILFPLIIYIRNSFTPIPFQIAFGVIIIMGNIYLSRKKAQYLYCNEM